MKKKLEFYFISTRRSILPAHCYLRNSNGSWHCDNSQPCCWHCDNSQPCWDSDLSIPVLFSASVSSSLKWR